MKVKTEYGNFEDTLSPKDKKQFEKDFEEELKSTIKNIPEWAIEKRLINRTVTAVMCKQIIKSHSKNKLVIIGVYDKDRTVGIIRVHGWAEEI